MEKPIHCFFLSRLIKSDSVKILSCISLNLVQFSFRPILNPWPSQCVPFWRFFLSSNLTDMVKKRKSEFSDKNYFCPILNFFNSILVILKKIKNAIVLAKDNLDGGRQFFHGNVFLKMPNTPDYAQFLVVTCPKLVSVTALLYPLLSGKLYLPVFIT